MVTFYFDTDVLIIVFKNINTTHPFMKIISWRKLSQFQHFQQTNDD